MNYVGIDISIDSCAVSMKRDEETMILNFTTQKVNNNWIKKTMSSINYEFINYTYKDIKNYTENEIMKLREFNHVTDLIYNKINTNLNKKDKTLIAVEGYSYGLRGNSIIDIVSFSTLLRIKLMDLAGLEKLIFVSPMTLKSFACEKSYGFTTNKNGKKIINKNLKNIPGGKFDKKDMLDALINLNEYDNLSMLLYKYKDELLSLKNVPKPIDDCIDADFLRRIISD
jgi:archaellum biogenesis ATPase FlaH